MTQTISDILSLKTFCDLVNAGSLLTEDVDLAADIDMSVTNASTLDEWTEGTADDFDAGDFALYYGAIYYRHSDTGDTAAPWASVDWSNAPYWTASLGWYGITDSNSEQFQGTFNGHGYTLRNCYMNGANRGSAGGMGLFNDVDGATIYDVTFEDFVINGTSACVGGAVGWTDDVYIYNCDVVDITVEGSAGRVGGLIGGAYYQSVIYNCTSSGTVTLTGASQGAGGLVGDMSGEVGDIGSVTLCSSSCNVTAGSGGTAGGLIGGGWSYGTHIQRCYATGDVTSTGPGVGGLVGVAWGPIEESYATGNCSGLNRVGGLCGVIIGSGYNPNITGSATNCYATGSVVSSAHEKVGGLVGWLNGGQITDCHAIGLVNEDAGTGTNIGGLLGGSVNSGTVTTSYYNSTTTNQSDDGRGEPLTATEYGYKTNFAGFDFDDTWFMAVVSGSPLPKLQALVASPVRIYRGQDGYIDYDTIVTIMEAADTQVSIPGEDLPANTIWHYVRRAVASCGLESESSPPCVVRIDAAGEVIGLTPNPPQNLQAEQVAGGKIKLTWRYSTSGQVTPPTAFKVYIDSGSGFDFETADATVTVTLPLQGVAGDPQITWTSDALTDGQLYKFCVRSYASTGESQNTNAVSAYADSTGPAGISTVISSWQEVD